MPTLIGIVRRRLLTPDLAETSFARRGFHARSPQAQRTLEHIGTQFLTGFGHAMVSRDAAEVARLLDDVERPYQGFAYEGASMALAITDAMTPWRRHRVRAFLAGPAAPHVYMVHVGIGWAMARLPRRLWRGVVPADPLLRWLAVDGYGFHQAYFATREYVTRQRPLEIAVPWPDPSGYARRAADQGVGRALWFVCGADVEHLATTVGAFAQDRRGDLWSGAGLAATYAGGVDATEIEKLRKLAAGYRRELAQGSAFAAKARLFADLVVPHTEEAVAVLCEMPVEQACRVTDTALADLPADGTAPAFEVWRDRIRGSFS
jgi:enediyne biosynthesis protein E3